MKQSKTIVKDAYLRDTIERFTRHKMAVVGLVVLLLEIVLLFLLPVVLGSQPNEITPYFSAPPSAEFPLGTDTTGRDLLARLLYGGQTSLGIGLLAVLVQALIGIPLGIIAGYYRGAAEVVIMRLADIFNSIPNMCLNLVLVTVFSPSFWTIVMVIGITGWPSFTRLLYSSVLSIREKEYVEAARAIGTKNSTIMIQYILPNALSPALVAFTFGVPSAILSESALSFLGLGIQIPQSTWGNMLNAAQSLAVVATQPWMWIPPGLCILITLISINLFGDGLRDALDPKTKVG